MLLCSLILSTISRKHLGLLGLFARRIYLILVLQTGEGANFVICEGPPKSVEFPLSLSLEWVNIPTSGMNGLILYTKHKGRKDTSISIFCRAIFLFFGL